MRPRSCKSLVIAAVLIALSVAQPALASDDLVARSGAQVARFLDQFSEVKCTEEVTQSKLVKKLGRSSVEYREEQRFDYLALAVGSGDDLTIQESRLPQSSPAHKKNLPLLVTNGFATMSLVFHPYYQQGFEFSAPEYEVVSGRRLAKVRFRHIQGRRTPTALVLRGREYPLELNGTAWIDPQSATVVRIETELQQNMSDLGLHVFSGDVEYAPVHLRGLAEEVWLPVKATIEVETAKQRWQNIHRFTNYQLFSVSTDESVKTQ